MNGPVFPQHLIGALAKQPVDPFAIPFDPVGRIGVSTAGTGIDLELVEPGLADPFAAKPALH